MQKQEGVIDLSLQDVYGNPIKQSTANCYVVSKPGTYKFPCVYGNAIKNGKTNAAAYTNNGGANSHDFVDGTNVVISSPYIEFGPYENTVSLRNYDTEDVIQYLSLDVDSGYITFTVTDVPPTGANAIVTLWTDGFPIWSWHIWLWLHDLSPVTITNASTVKYNIMPVNLATKYDHGLSYMKNWFYQFGRPMPLLCPDDYNSTSNHIPGSILISNAAANLYEGIQNPDTFYKYESTNYNWFSTKVYYNLWNAARSNYGLWSRTIKTVYDPCPVGWKVPTYDVFDALTLENNGDDFVIVNDSVARTFEFNLTGYRNSYSGGISTTDVGYYAVETLNRISGTIMVNGWYMAKTRGVYSGSGMELSFGTSIRPVEDSIEFGDVISFTISGNTYQAEEGMTWFEWVVSDYNTGEYYSKSAKVRYDSNYVVGGVSLDTVIIEGKTYYHRLSAG